MRTDLLYSDLRRRAGNSSHRYDDRLNSRANIRRNDVVDLRYAGNSGNDADKRDLCLQISHGDRYG